MVSIVIYLVCVLPTAFLTFMFKRKNIILKILTLVLSLIVLGFCAYILIVNSAFMSIDELN